MFSGTFFFTHKVLSKHIKVYYNIIYNIDNTLDVPKDEMAIFQAQLEMK